MSLPIGERRKLRRMERDIARADPRLESLYSMFTKLSGLDAMPRPERVRAMAVRRAVRRAARLRRAAPLSNAG
jgi:hypothetical protein